MCCIKGLTCNNRRMQSNTVFSALIFSLASISMILLNKWVVVVYPHSATLLLLQNVTTIVILYVINPQHKMRATLLWSWLPCALIFCVNIFSSLESLTTISVPTFTIFRNTQPIIAIVIDYVLRHQTITYASFHFLVMILIGAVIYCKHDTNVDFYGYLWAVIHVLSMSVYSVLVKYKSELLEITASEMSLYNNVISVPVLCVISLAYSVHNKSNYVTQLDHAYTCIFQQLCILPVLLSCIGGYAVSVAAFNAQKVMSPISFLTLNNISKIPAICISVILFNTTITLNAWHGMVLSMAAGYLYAISRQYEISFPIITVAWSAVAVIVYVAFFI